jgi:hypothetical protein
MSMGATGWCSENGLYLCNNCDMQTHYDHKNKFCQYENLGKYANKAKNKLIMLCHQNKDNRKFFMTLNNNEPIDKFLFDSGLFYQNNHDDQYYFIHKVFLDYCSVISILQCDPQIIEETILKLVELNERRIICLFTYVMRESIYSRKLLSIIEDRIFKQLLKIQDEDGNRLLYKDQLNLEELGLYLAFELASILNIDPKIGFLNESLEFLEYKWGLLIRPAAIYGGPKIVEWIFIHIDNDPWSSQPSFRKKKINSVIHDLGQFNNESIFALNEELQSMNLDLETVNIKMNHSDRAKICIVMFNLASEYKTKKKRHSIRQLRKDFPGISGHELKGRQTLNTAAEAQAVALSMRIKLECPFPRIYETRIYEYLGELFDRSAYIYLFSVLGFLLVVKPPLYGLESDLTKFKNDCQNYLSNYF